MTNSNSDNLLWLCSWFKRHCDGNWEHSQGVTIESIDNPGWRVTIDLVGTELDAQPDGSIREDGEPPNAANAFVGGAEWTSCEVKDSRLIGAGDPSKLNQILTVLREWVEERS
jgi:hypothetical protein